MISRRIKYRLGYFLCIFLIAVAALAGAIALGQFYLRIVREGSIPRYTKVSTDNSKSVAAQDGYKAVMLNPIPVYFLQVGVYSDIPGAQEAAKPLQQLGYTPYITGTAPYKIWIGLFQSRSDTEIIKQQLKDKGVGSFTGSIVVNGSNLRYGREREDLVKAVMPLMEAYTSWLKENLQLFHADSVERLNWSAVDKQQTVISRVYDQVDELGAGFNSNNEEINEGFRVLGDTTGVYHKQLLIFTKQRDQQNYAALQNCLLRFIDNYQQLWQRIDNISKT